MFGTRPSAVARVMSGKVKRGNSGHSLVLTDSLAHNFGNKIARARKI